MMPAMSAMKRSPPITPLTIAPTGDFFFLCEEDDDEPELYESVARLPDPVVRVPYP